MTSSTDQTAMLQALQSLLGPLASLAVSQGLTYAAVDELLRQAFVNAAREAHGHLPVERGISRISATTGLNRREVKRLTEQPVQAALPVLHRWPAGEVFTRWLSDEALPVDATGARRLLRQGPAPSFESLARSVTRDVHPRSLLDELCRLGLAAVEGDHVVLQRDALVPQGDFAKTLGFLGDNVGDHLRAAAVNALGEGNEHFEQAIYGDELSADSALALRPLVSSLWQQLFAQLIPALEALMAEDKAAGRLRDQRVRVGLYAFSAKTETSGEST